jgi:hypothetical protein
MSINRLTGDEARALDPEIARGRTLQNQYTFENCPQAFLYGDSLVKGALSDVEKRNLALTEDVYLDCYNYHCIGQLGYSFLYDETYPTLQLPFSEYLRGHKERKLAFPKHDGAGFRTYDEYKRLYYEWVEDKGRSTLDKLREEKPGKNEFEWQILMEAPDRTMQLVNVIPAGNQVIGEGIISWTEKGVIKDVIFAVALLFDDDCSVLQDRSWNDLYQWPLRPHTSKRKEAFDKGMAQEGQVAGRMEAFLKRAESATKHRDLNAVEKRNTQLTESQWVQSFNSHKFDIFHPDRYRRQWPVQHMSYKLATVRKIDAILETAVPDRKLRPVYMYAYGNQVAAECVVSWTDKGVYKETPVISFLLFDKDGLIIRERTHINLDHFPGAAEIERELSIPHYATAV